jgi:tyrosyl-tRNA synthetase
MDFFQEMTWREAIHDASEGVAEHLAKGRVTAYTGFDPTAKSLHVGSLVQLVALKRLRASGHRPMALVGGATGMVGDPSGKSKERNLLDADAVRANVAAIRRQVATILEIDERHVVDNIDWIERMNVVEFLRDVGKHFSVSAMLARDSIRRRIDYETGISYTEFSYVVLQALDYLVLNERHGCSLQMGGSDQWGNIVSGIDLIRAKRGQRVFGLTLPLVTTSSGTKFGKTEEGAVWLDRDMTSPYRFYQFWLNTTDADAIRYLKQFTFLGRDEIDDLARQQAAAPQERIPQRRLAEEVTKLVHGASDVERAVRASAVFFGAEPLDAMSAADVLEVFEDVPSSTQPKDRFAGEGTPLVDLLVDAALATSKKDARRSIESGGVYVNNHRVAAPDARVALDQAIDGRIVVLRKGKKSYHVVKLEGGS